MMKTEEDRYINKQLVLLINENKAKKKPNRQKEQWLNIANIIMSQQLGDSGNMKTIVYYLLEYDMQSRLDYFANNIRLIIVNLSAKLITNESTKLQ